MYRWSIQSTIKALIGLSPCGLNNLLMSILYIQSLIKFNEIYRNLRVVKDVNQSSSYVQYAIDTLHLSSKYVRGLLIQF